MPNESSRDDFAGVKDLVLDQHVPVASVRVIEMIGPDGKQCYTVTYAGDVPVTTFLGLLDLAKMDIVSRFMEQEDPEEDDEDDELS